MTFFKYSLLLSTYFLLNSQNCWAMEDDLLDNNISFPVKSFKSLSLEDNHKQAINHNVSAQSKLRKVYNAKQEIFKTPQQAFIKYQKLSENNDIIASIILGWMYRDGFGTEENSKKAFELFQNAAKKGYAAAQSNLGWMYLEGQGVSKDEKEAVKWFTLSAKQGYAPAQEFLGMMYLEGKIVPKNEKEALKWYKLAAEQGDEQAQFSIGWMYLNGEGVLQDDERASYWLCKAKENGNLDAINLLILLKEKLDNLSDILGGKLKTKENEFIEIQKEEKELEKEGEEIDKKYSIYKKSLAEIDNTLKNNKEESNTCILF